MRQKRYQFNEDISMLEVDPVFLAEGVAFAAKKNYKAIRIIALNDETIGKPCVLDLSPLTGNKSITALDLGDDFDISAANIDAIYTLNQLKELGFLGEKPLPFDFSRLTQLESLFLKHNHALTGLHRLKKLKELLVISLNEKDCSSLRGLTSLEHLRLTRGTFKSLSGIEHLPKLAKVKLAYCAELRDASALNTLPRLKHLHIEKCKRLTDFSFLAGNASIEKLFISELDSVSFVPRMKRLSGISFWNSKDGDLSPLMQGRSLTKVHFCPQKKHYSHTVKAINDALGGQ